MDDFKSINEPDSTKPPDFPGSINEPQAPVPPAPPPAPPEKKPAPKKAEVVDPDELEAELEEEEDEGEITRVAVTKYKPPSKGKK